MKTVSLALVTTSLMFTAIACSGSDAPSDINGDPAQGSPPAFGDTSNDPVGTNAACVTSLKSASLPPVNLVIMYDKSGSMGNPAEGGDPATKWIPVNAGMKAFFADPASAGYNASLQFFPAPGDLATTCGADYGRPLVPLTSLAGAGAPLATALDSASPTGGTPTVPALRGAIGFAQQTIAARPDERTVVVLVTDGEPGFYVNGQPSPGCADNDLTHLTSVAQSAFQASPAVPTFVIGVGSSLTKLEAIAVAGGTEHALMISVANPAQTRSELQSAFEAIRSRVKVPCSFSLPAAPAGQTLDRDHINVAFTVSSGTETPLVYSKDCTAANGWRYDNALTPSQIELCPTSCNVAQADPNGKISVAMGCKTNVEVR